MVEYGSWLHTLYHHYTILLVVTGTTLLGATCGVLGTYASLRGYSLLGDAIAHAALPGIASLFLLTQTNQPLMLLLGGMITGSLVAAMAAIARSYTPLKSDALLGTLLSVFFGLGLVLMTQVQKLPLPHQSALNKFIFGNAATLMLGDIYLISALTIIVCISIALFWNLFALCTFDPLFARTVGCPTTWFDSGLLLLFILTVIIGLQTIGVMLMSALLIAPAAAARQWSTTLLHMTILAGIIGALSACTGTTLSYYGDHIPTGPAIIIIVTLIAGCSLICSPRRTLFFAPR